MGAELYLDAMKDAGADSAPIHSFLALLSGGLGVDQALAQVDLLPNTREFVTFTIDLASSGEPHEVAAAFCFGREDIIPQMFQRLLPRLREGQSETDRFRYYLERHIEIDGDHHGPMARQLVQHLCGGGPRKEREAKNAALRAIGKRRALWDGVLSVLNELSTGSEAAAS